MDKNALQRRIRAAWDRNELKLGEAADLSGMSRTEAGAEQAEYLLTVLEREGEAEFHFSMANVRRATERAS